MENLVRTTVSATVHSPGHQIFLFFLSALITHSALSKGTQSIQSQSSQHSELKAQDLWVLCCALFSTSSLEIVSLGLETDEL